MPDCFRFLLVESQRACRRIGPSAALAIALLACSVCLPDGAQAYEDQGTLGAGLGYALHGREHGIAVQLSGSVGLGETLALRSVLGYALHPSATPLHVGLASVELVYAIDVVELVPWFGLGAGGVLRAQRDAERPDFAVNAALGLDYLLSRELTFTFELRPYLLLTDLEREAFYGTVMVSLSWMLDT